jgi:hypothetical protein
MRIRRMLKPFDGIQFVPRTNVLLGMKIRKSERMAADRQEGMGKMGCGLV